MKTKKTGKQTYAFENPPVIASSFAIGGEMEREGPLSAALDEAISDNLWGEDSWEKAESKFLQQAILGSMAKLFLAPKDIDLMFAGDLLNQCAATNYGIRVFSIPFIGMYGACSTMGLTMLQASMAIDGGFADRAVCATSSHFCSAERQFRFPLAYGGQRPPSAQWTVTGAASVVLSSPELSQGVHIESVTPGKIIDRGVTDANNMGAAMAPAAIDTLCTHFQDTNTVPSDYDAIFTGDLGSIGKSIVIDGLAEQGFDMSQNYEDCGCVIFSENQDVHAGGSGCACSGLTLCSHILPKLTAKEWKKVLFVPTGALMSTTAVQQGESIPSVAHALSLSAE